MKKSILILVSSALLILLAGAGCSQQPDADDAGTSPEQNAGQSDMTIPQELQEPVEQARQDLAERVDIEPAAIILAQAHRVTWPSGALGCPEPGMMYTQALVPGYRIVLEAGEQRHHYHGGRGQDPFYCPPDRVTKPVDDEQLR